MNSDDKSGIQESFDTALEGEVGGVGRTLVGVCNKELKIKININNCPKTMSDPQIKEKLRKK